MNGFTAHIRQATVLEDSFVSTGNSVDRLTTLEVNMPRCILSEFNTHRALSRNSASSRAIPTARMLNQVEENPFIPSWPANGPGMSPSSELPNGSEEIKRLGLWLKARDAAVASAKALSDMGVHKQVANRLLEPFMWQTVIVSATEWSNFLTLRRAEPAQKEIRDVADAIASAIDMSTPRPRHYWQWHTPLLREPERDTLTADHPTEYTFWLMVSAGRCARVSYLKHGEERDAWDDYTLAKRLALAGHWSPFEHVARPLPPDQEKILRESRGEEATRSNFRGWLQLRKCFLGEHDAALVNDEADDDRMDEEQEDNVEWVRGVRVFIPAAFAARRKPPFSA